MQKMINSPISESMFVKGTTASLQSNHFQIPAVWLDSKTIRFTVPLNRTFAQNTTNDDMEITGHIRIRSNGVMSPDIELGVGNAISYTRVTPVGVCGQIVFDEDVTYAQPNHAAMIMPNGNLTLTIK